MENWMMGENKIINDFNEYSIWINTLKGMKEELWVAPHAHQLKDRNSTVFH